MSDQVRLGFFLALFSLASLFYLAGAAQPLSITQAAAANQTLSRAEAYVSLVNESGYLVFYPNLTQAYADLNKSMQLYNNSPGSAVVFANEAVDSARIEYARIQEYKEASFVVMLVISIVLVAVFLKIMKPVKNRSTAAKNGQ